MYSWFRKGPFQLGRKAILGLSWPGCAPGLSGLPAGPGGAGEGARFLWVRSASHGAGGEEESSWSVREGERETLRERRAGMEGWV